jgi:hypothetical protein
MPYTIVEKLQQLIDAPYGSSSEPAFLFEETKSSLLRWDEPLRKRAQEVLSEIDRLKRLAGEI